MASLNLVQLLYHYTTFSRSGETANNFFWKMSEKSPLFILLRLFLLSKCRCGLMNCSSFYTLQLLWCSLLHLCKKQQTNLLRLSDVAGKIYFWLVVRFREDYPKSLKSNEFVSLRATFHKEGYLTVKEMHVHRYRRLKIAISILPVMIVGWIFFRKYKFNSKKMVFIERWCQI